MHNNLRRNHFQPNFQGKRLSQPKAEARLNKLSGEPLGSSAEVWLDFPIQPRSGWLAGPEWLKNGFQPCKPLGDLAIQTGSLACSRGEEDRQRAVRAGLRRASAMNF